MTTNTAIDQPRTTAGRFGNKPTRAPQIALTADGISKEQREQRHAALADAGLIPAVSGSAERSGVTTRKVNTWWDSHFVRAEYRPANTGYPQMPDDYTPANTGGNALSGNRHTHRMKYEGKDVTVRMPSASSIKRYAKDQAGTFDVPITATYPGGDISGWCRVTQNGVAEWSVQGLNFPQGDAVQVAEAVSAILESRRPSTALRDAGDLAERRRERIAAGGQKIAHEQNGSRFVIGTGFDTKAEVAVVQMDGKAYGYKVTKERFQALMSAKSIGSAYNRLIKGRSKTAQVVVCQKCGNFNVGNARHRCPSKHKAPGKESIEHVGAARQAALNATR